MKARFVVLVYFGTDYKNTGKVERTNYNSSCDGAIASARSIAKKFNRYVEVWDIKTDKVVWETGCV